MSLTLPRFGGLSPAKLVSSISGVFMFPSFLVVTCIFKHPDARYPVLSQPKHGKQDVLIFDLVTLGRQSPEEPEQKTANRLEFVFRQPDAQFVIHLADVGFPIDD